MRLLEPDLVLLHPPAVYDFRDRQALFGPVSDVVFSSPVFDMYPVGLTSIAGRVERDGWNVRVVNLARRMLADPGYDPEEAVGRMHPLLFGIDLHWLLHVQGALEVARLVKRHHPETPVVVGGLSASYYAEELVARPEVDMVLRGDSTEEAVAALLRVIDTGGSLEEVPGLLWRDAAGRRRTGPLPPAREERVEVDLPDYGWAIRSVLRDRGLADVLPYAGWREYPVTGVLTSRGCTQECAFCGGGRSAYRRTCGRTAPGLRPPAALARHVRFIERFSRAPVVLLNDLRVGGARRAARFFELMGERPCENELVYELFFPADPGFFRGAAAASRRFSLQISLESHLPPVRRLVGKFTCPNRRIEETLRAAVDAGVSRVDLFFMVGLPGQSYEDAVGTVDYCRELAHTVGDGGRLRFFATPLGPFLDPASPAFEDPAAHGYRLRWRTLEEHREALTATTWKEMLNYETDAMTREEIVAATYACYDGLARLDLERGILEPSAFRAARRKTRLAREVIARADAALALPEGDERQAELDLVGRRIADLKQQVGHSKEQLKWPVRRRLAPIPVLAVLVLEQLWREAARLLTRRLPLLWHRGPRRVLGRGRSWHPSPPRPSAAQGRSRAAP